MEKEIKTALFSWKHHEATMSLPHCFLWCGSVNWARKHFDNVVLVADDKARKFLAEGLQLPFTEVLELPPIPDELNPLYDLVKLNAHRLLALRGTPAIHIDYDCFLRKPLPVKILTAPYSCEYIYTPRQFVTDINNGLKLKMLDQENGELNLGLAAGISGGCDSETILDWTEKAIYVATHPDNRNFLLRQNGYQASVLFGEVAPGSYFKGRVETLFASENANDRTEEIYRKNGYIHLAGPLKKDRGAMAQAAMRVQLDFPEEFKLTAERLDNLS